MSGENAAARMTCAYGGRIAMLRAARPVEALPGVRKFEVAGLAPTNTMARLVREVELQDGQQLSASWSDRSAQVSPVASSRLAIPTSRFARNCGSTDVSAPATTLIFIFCVSPSACTQARLRIPGASLATAAFHRTAADARASRSLESYGVRVGSCVEATVSDATIEGEDLCWCATNWYRHQFFHRPPTHVFTWLALFQL
eukprot:SAG11_NODE_8587_length_998_cov_1.804227_1_plen_200_part_00